MDRNEVIGRVLYFQGWALWSHPFSYHNDRSVKLCGQDPEGNHLNEKYILKEAMRPYVTDEIYKRTKHPYLAPAEPGAPPIARLLNKWVTKERVDHLGFLNWERCETIKERVITSDDCMAYCDMLKLVSLLILHEQFNVAPVTYL